MMHIHLGRLEPSRSLQPRALNSNPASGLLEHVRPSTHASRMQAPVKLGGFFHVAIGFGGLELSYATIRRIQLPTWSRRLASSLPAHSTVSQRASFCVTQMSTRDDGPFEKSGGHVAEELCARLNSPSIPDRVHRSTGSLGLERLPRASSKGTYCWIDFVLPYSLFWRQQEAPGSRGPEETQEGQEGFRSTRRRANSARQENSCPPSGDPLTGYH